jgi:hypothetical protein
MCGDDPQARQCIARAGVGCGVPPGHHLGACGKMELALEVGILADLKVADEEGYASYVEEFESLSSVLRSEGLGEHVEPKELGEIFSCDMLSYTGIHYLRRIAVHLALGKSTPAPGNRETYQNVALNEEYFESFNAGEDMKYQHLIVHSDAEGFYVPIDFNRVIATPTSRLSGGWVGSTQRLQAECIQLAGLLSMPLDMHYESRELSRAADAQLHPHSKSSRSVWPWKRPETRRSGASRSTRARPERARSRMPRTPGPW